MSNSRHGGVIDLTRISPRWRRQVAPPPRAWRCNLCAVVVKERERVPHALREHAGCAEFLPVECRP